jgi:hypothetical protein
MLLFCNNFNLRMDDYALAEHPFLNSSIIDTEWQIIKSKSFDSDSGRFSANEYNYY